MKTYKQTHPNEATPIQKAKLVGIAKKGLKVDVGHEHLHGSESDSAYFVSVGREDAHATDLIRIAKIGNQARIQSGEQSAAENQYYPKPISNRAAAGAIDLANRQ